MDTGGRYVSIPSYRVNDSYDKVACSLGSEYQSQSPHIGSMIPTDGEEIRTKGLVPSQSPHIGSMIPTDYPHALPIVEEKSQSPHIGSMIPTD